MSTACEVQCSLTNSRSEAEEQLISHKDVEFSYTRQFLLSLAKLDICNRLPIGFDSSILSELNNASAGSPFWFCSVTDSGSSDDSLSRDFQSTSSSFGVSSTKAQGSSCHPPQPSELNNASTGSQQSSSDTESGRWDGSPSQHSQQNPECGLLRREALPKYRESLAANSPPVVQGNSCHLLNRSATPYRPPHLSKMNHLSRTESKHLTAGNTFEFLKYSSPGKQENESRERDSLDLNRKEHNPIEGKQQNVPAEYKVSSDLDTHRMDSRNNKGILSKCYGAASSAPNNASSSSSRQAFTCGGKLSPTSSGRSFENNFQTKLLHHSPTQEQYDVKVDKIEISMSSSSISVDQFTVEEKEPAGGVLIGNEIKEPEVYIEPSTSAVENGSTSVSCHDSEVPLEPVAPSAHPAAEKDSNHCSSMGSIMCQDGIKGEETEPSIELEASENQFDRHQCKEHKLIAPATEKITEQLDSASISVMPPGVIMCMETVETGALDVTEMHIALHQAAECYDIGRTLSKTASHSGSTQHLLDLLKKGKDTEALEAACSNQFSAMTAEKLEVGEDHFSQHQSEEDYDVERENLRTASHSGSAQHLFDLLKKGKEATDVEAAWSNLSSSSNARTTQSLERNVMSEDEAGSTKKLHLITSNDLTEYDFLWHVDFPSPLDSEVILLPIDELIGVEHQATTSLNCGQKTDLNERKGSDLASSEDEDEIKSDSLSAQALELTPVDGFDEKANAIDEVCLPDEDSLITLDELVFQMDTILLADNNSTEAHLVASANNTQKSNAYNVSIGNENSPSSLGNATLVSNGVSDSKTSYDDIDVARKPYPRSQTHPRKPVFHHSAVRSSASKIHSYGPIRRQHQMIIPGEFPHPWNILSGGAHSDQMQYYRPWLNQNFNQNYEHQIYGISDPDPSLLGNNRLLGTAKAEQIHPRWPWSRNV
ncbi:uncharacterized protein LOC126673479 [Mercurialis annua]|uniref:uncharacterized protein LOC126673479 n=1 Tax=Mercurialis annua TaxID=3986 RepID=UPI00215FAF09|nr:uncharacterized protein LOC126673479 [Mercurialis annua]